MSKIKYGLPRTLSEQSIFDKVYAHLMTQGDRCFEDGNCQYVSSDGKACAVGCLMAGRLNHQAYTGDFAGIRRLDGRVMSKAMTAWRRKLYPFRSLIRELQVVHDWAPPEPWRHRLFEAARSRGLTVPVMEKA